MTDEPNRNESPGDAKVLARSTRPVRKVFRNLPTGVAGLDAILGGGLPEFSFNMLAGGPGAGKTTLAQQILFANATRERPALWAPNSPNSSPSTVAIAARARQTRYQ